MNRISAILVAATVACLAAIAPAVAGSPLPIAGRVVDVSGRPLPSAKILCLPTRGWSTIDSSETVSDGTFVISGLRADAYELTIDLAGYATWKSVVAAGTLDLLVTLQLIPTIAVQLVVPQGATLPATITGMGATGVDSWDLTFVQGPAGRLVSTVPFAKADRVCLFVPNFRPVSLHNPQVLAGQTVTLTAALERGGSVLGNLTTADGAPASGALIRVLQPQMGATEHAYADAYLLAPPITTDATGQFTLMGAPQGDFYIVAVATDSKHGAVSAPLSVSATGTIAIGLTLSANPLRPPH